MNSGVYTEYWILPLSLACRIRELPGVPLVLLVPQALLAPLVPLVLLAPLVLVALLYSK